MLDNPDQNVKNEKCCSLLIHILEDTWHLGRQMSRSDCAERDGTYITLSCVFSSIVADSGGCYCLYRFICVLH
jgi:hypothetical protein